MPHIHGRRSIQHFKQGSRFWREIFSSSRCRMEPTAQQQTETADQICRLFCTQWFDRKNRIPCGQETQQGWDHSFRHLPVYRWSPSHHTGMHGRQWQNLHRMCFRQCRMQEIQVSALHTYVGASWWVKCRQKSVNFQESHQDFYEDGSADTRWVADPGNDSPISDAIMDRIVHNFHEIMISRRISMRERHGINASRKEVGDHE